MLMLSFCGWDGWFAKSCLCQTQIQLRLSLCFDNDAINVEETTLSCNCYGTWQGAAVFRPIVPIIIDLALLI